MLPDIRLSPDFRIGFIGGGQLARMSAYQAGRFGFKTGALTSPSGNDPMEAVTPHTFRGDANSEETLLELAEWSDVITLENEFLDANLLRKVSEKSGTPIIPSADAFEKVEDKFIEKTTFSNAGIPVATFAEVKNEADLKSFGAKTGWPYVLKSAKGGYDGYGNKTVGTVREAAKAFDDLGGNSGKQIIAEEWVTFEKELAVIVARNEFGTVIYPCCETIQENHICKVVIAPAPVDRHIRKQAEEIAVSAMEAIGAYGLFAFEFFLTKDGRLLLNESAPRPHNSGHYSIEACQTSQFENHIRTISDMKPGSTAMRSPYAVMINMLGKKSGPAIMTGFEALDEFEDTHLHIYGKQVSRPGRKMGHLTLLGNNPQELLQKARNIESNIYL